MKYLWSLYLILIAPSLYAAEKVSDTPWQHPLYLDNNGYWKQRIPCTIQNNTQLNLKGDPFHFTAGKGKGKLPLEGVLAESIRVTNAAGDQLLFRVTDSEGNQLERGPIPSKATITIPLENQAGEKSEYYIYFDNASAWAVGEYLYTHRKVVNGGFENEDPSGPVEWELEWPEKNRDVNWSSSLSHSGTYSIKLTSEKAGEESNYGAKQSDIHLIPGESYKVEAWFKTEELDGEAGLVLLPGNLGRTQRNLILEPIHLKAEKGENGWSKADLEFTAPKEANILTISTYIEGTGTLWVDDVRLSCEADYNLSANVRPVETVPIKDKGNTSRWVSDSDNWPIRASITVPNFTELTLKEHPVYVDIQQLKHRLFDEIDETTLIRITDGMKIIPYLEMGNAILFKQDIPASTVRTFYVYFSGTQNTEKIQKPDTFSELSQITENLIGNANFDAADVSGWKRFGETDSKKIITEKENSNPLVRIDYSAKGEGGLIHDIEVSHSDAESAIGLSQTFEVEPGNSYFFSARVKSSNVLDRTYTLRARFLNSAGELTGDEKSLQANPDMFQNFEWVQDTMIIQAPKKASSVKVELLNTAEGKVWYDDVFFMKIGIGYTGALAVERKAEGDIKGLEVWYKDPLARAFPDDLPKETLHEVNISAARNDAEAAQLLFRSQDEYENLKIKVAPLRNKQGNSLDDIEIGIVGYVPINYPSNYYRDFVTPFWRTKMPVGKIGSDGWTGWWADPILPYQNFDLPANTTKAVWIEVDVPENAKPGHYTGTIQVLRNGKALKKIPFNMQVYDFVLPKTPSVKATYNPRFNEEKMFGRVGTEQEKREDLWRLMAKHKISPSTIKPQPTVTVKDGEVTLDFTDFDKAAVTYFEENKFASIWSPRDIFYLFGWGHTPYEKFGEKPYPGEAPYPGVDRSQLRPEYKRRYQSALRQYWEHMKEKGWEDKVVIYISDEPHADPDMLDQMKAVCDMIHEVDPEIRIYVSTWWYRPEFEGYVDVWGVSHRGGGWGHSVPAEHLREIKKNGGDLFFTTDGMQCTDTPFLGYERLLPHFCFKYGASEFEFWAINWHTLDPYHYGWHRFHRQSPSADVWYWMRYPNGDGTMIYPGHPLGVNHNVTSVRLKQSREGVEDYEFMHALRQLIEKGTAEGKNTQQAQKALDRALDLVNIPSADGRYTTDYTPKPELLMAIRHEVATAVEELSK